LNQAMQQSAVSDPKSNGNGGVMELARAIEAALQTRTLTLMTQAERVLSVEAAEAIAGGSILSQEQERARKLYSRYYANVFRWYKRRVNDAGKITITYPDWLILADLNWAERALLADVAWLQKQERGCDKSILVFAIELGTSVCAIKRMIVRLRKTGWLQSKRAGSKRLLEIVNKKILELKSGQEEVNNCSPRGEQKVTGMVNKKSPPSEQMSPTTDCKRKLSAQRANGIATGDQPLRLQRQQIDDEDETGAAPPDPASSSSPTGAAPPDPRPSLEPKREEEDQDQSEADYFSGLWRFARKATGQSAKLSDQDREAIEEFFSDEGNDAFETLCVIARAWDLIGEKADNGYDYKHCLNSRKVAYCLKNFDGLVSDTGSSKILGGSYKKIVGDIAQSLELDKAKTDYLYSRIEDDADWKALSNNEGASL
jgi:hypothetical protein